MYPQFLSDIASFIVQTAENAALESLKEQQQQHEQTLERLSQATDSHEVAAILLEQVGATRETAYQLMPKMHARTVRRLTVRMCMCSDSLTETNTLGQLESGVLDDIQEAAKAAKVRPQIAIAAITRYLNSPERVKTVLDDMTALQREHVRIWNPTGFFTRLMRSGESVKLPERVQQARNEALRAKQEQESRPKAAPGVLVRLYGEICEILSVSRQFALVRTALDDIKVPLDSLRFVTP